MSALCLPCCLRRELGFARTVGCDGSARQHSGHLISFFFFSFLRTSASFPVLMKQQPLGIRALGVCTAELTVGGEDDFSLLRGGVWVLDDLQGSHSPDSRVQSDRALVYGRVTCACDLVGGRASQRSLVVDGHVVQAVGVGLTGAEKDLSLVYVIKLGMRCLQPQYFVLLQTKFFTVFLNHFI